MIYLLIIRMESILLFGNEASKRKMTDLFRSCNVCHVLRAERKDQETRNRVAIKGSPELTRSAYSTLTLVPELEIF